VRQCERCYTLDHGSASHDFQECIRRANPRRRLFDMLDMDLCCVAGGFAATLVRELRFPHSKSEHLLLLEALRTRDVDVFCYPFVTKSAVGDPLRQKLEAAGEWVFCHGKPGRLQIQTLTLGAVDVVISRMQSGFYPDDTDLGLLRLTRNKMTEIVSRFDFDASRIGIAYLDGILVVVDLDFQRPYRLCCYCHNDKLKARVSKYQQRGHDIRLYTPDHGVPLHSACAICLHGFDYNTVASGVNKPLVDREIFTRCCYHGACTNVCLRHSRVTNPHQRSTYGHLSDRLPPRFTRLSSCCWVSRFTEQDSDPLDFGPLKNGLTGKDRRDLRMLDFRSYS
jgi:hypothetical protein